MIDSLSGILVVQHHPLQRPRPVGLGDNTGHGPFESAQRPIAPAESDARPGVVMAVEPGYADAFRAPVARVGDVGEQVPDDAWRSGNHDLSVDPHPGDVCWQHTPDAS